jgi:phosphopantothenoylcysteine decarboxylase/phosphopantothenate--cysteine ligase
MEKRLTNRRILLGVTGGIAAYKSADLIRRLQDRGATVRVVMTEAAQAFITPLTMQALSGHPVHTDLLDHEAEAAMGHIELARWADCVLVAPATADFMARMAAGKGDDLLTTLCLATPAPVVLAPAMNQGMWRDAATQRNLQQLKENGVSFIGPADGSQACGDIGPGRMTEPDAIADALAMRFESRLLDGLKVVITAGPTREAIDPVRYISNHSSGKMGFALAEAAANAGANVVLISGPVNLPTPEHVKRIDVISAEDMHVAVMGNLPDSDIFVGAAAVADYRPVSVAAQKLKKTSMDELTIQLVRNPDIISAVASVSPKPFTVGFAAETERVAEHARDKLQRKNLDMIIANDVSNSEVGFNSDDNAVVVYWPQGEKTFMRANKYVLAEQLWQLIADWRNAVANHQ